MENAKLLGLKTDADEKFSIRQGDWQAMKLAIWRSSYAWEIAIKEANEIISNCAHADGCSGATIETEPCLPGCSDREKRMSALVILNAAKQFASVDVRKPTDAPYFAPSREYFSQIVSQLGAAQVELDTLRAKSTVITEPAPKELP
jgi:hypothetical protein